MPSVTIRAVEAMGPNPKLTVAADLPLIETLLSRPALVESKG